MPLMTHACKYMYFTIKFRVLLAGQGQTVAMVSYCVTKIRPTLSPMIEQWFDTMIIASSDKVWL